MKTAQSVQRQVLRALAFAHAALDETTTNRVAQAKIYAAEVLPQIASMRPQSLGDARQLFENVSQLRAVLGVLDRKLELRARCEGN